MTKWWDRGARVNQIESTVSFWEQLDPFASEGLTRRVLPFAASALVAVLVLASTGVGSWVDVSVAFGLHLAVIGSFFLLPWDRIPNTLQVVPLLCWVAGIAWLTANFAVEDGMTRPILLLPIMWTAIYHKRSHLYMVVGLGAILGVIGGQFFGRDTSWQVAVLPIVVTLPVAFTVQTFANRVREAVRISKEASLVDPLTGLANRRRLEMELPRALQMSVRTKKPISLLVIDLDHFKAYNDTEGHLAGDALLATVAGSWSRELRVTDHLFRYGGEEFIALLPDCDETGARDVAARFMRSMPDSQSCSIGVAVSVEGETPTQLIERTDVAMYRAKQQGRGQFVVWDEEINAQKG